MLAAATKKHTLGTVLTLALCSLVALWAYRWTGQRKAAAFADQLQTASTPEVEKVLEQMLAKPAWCAAELDQRYATMHDASRAKNRTAIGLLALTPERDDVFDYLAEQQVRADLPTQLVIGRLLGGHPRRTKFAEELWTEMRADDMHADQRFRTALALAAVDPPRDEASRERWKPISEFFGRETLDRVSSQPRFYADIIAGLRPARETVLPTLVGAINETTPSRRRDAAVDCVLDLFGDDDDLTTDILLNVRGAKHADMLNAIELRFDQVRGALDTAGRAAPKTIDNSFHTDAELDRLRAAQDLQAARQANAAILFLRRGSTPAHLWRLFGHSHIPNTRFRLLDRIAESKIDARLLSNQLAVTQRSDELAGLILALGKFSFDDRDQELLLKRVQENFLSHPDREVHAASAWFLAQHEQLESLGVDAVEVSDLGCGRFAERSRPDPSAARIDSSAQGKVLGKLGGEFPRANDGQDRADSALGGGDAALLRAF